MAVGERVFGMKPAALFGPGAVKETEAGLDVALVIVEVFEFASEDDAEIQADAGPVNIAERETVDKAGAGEHKFAAVLELVSELYYKLSSVAAWDLGASSGVVFEPRLGVVFVAVFQDEYMIAPCENTQGSLSEVLAGAQFGSTVVEPALLNRPEPVKLDLFAECMVEEWDVSAG